MIDAAPLPTRRQDAVPLDEISGSSFPPRRIRSWKQGHCNSTPMRPSRVPRPTGRRTRLRRRLLGARQYSSGMARVQRRADFLDSLDSSQWYRARAPMGPGMAACTTRDNGVRRMGLTAGARAARGTRPRGRDGPGRQPERRRCAGRRGRQGMFSRSHSDETSLHEAAHLLIARTAGAAVADEADADGVAVVPIALGPRDVAPGSWSSQR